MKERLKVCWYALTKKHYAFYAFDRKEVGNSGAVCYIESTVESCPVLLDCIIEYTQSLFDKLYERDK